MHLQYRLRPVISCSNSFWLYYIPKSVYISYNTDFSLYFVGPNAIWEKDYGLFLAEFPFINNRLWSYYRYCYTDYGLYLAPRISHCEPAAGRRGNPLPFVFASICLFSVRIDSFFLKCYNPLEISFRGKVCLITADKKSKLLPWYCFLFVLLQH